MNPLMRGQFLIFRVIVGVAILVALGACASADPGSGSPSLQQTAIAAPSTSSQAALIAADTPRASAGAGSGTSSSTEQRSIVVIGSGSLSARPDRAIVSAGVQSRATSAQDAHDANSRAMQGVIDAIKGIGIPERAIRTSGISLYPVADDKQVITGYVAMNNVTITVDDIDQAGTVLDTAVKAGANTAGNVQFTLKDPTTLRNKALTAAVADAKLKGGILAEAIGIVLSSLFRQDSGSVTTVSQ